MKTASYTTVQTASGNSGKYPLSTQTLDFIQSQILLLQKLSLTVGNRYIIKKPDGESSGVVVIDGEVLDLAATPVYNEEATKYIVVTVTKDSITADDETYLEARITRTAAFATSAVGDEIYDIADFVDFSESGIWDKILSDLKDLKENFEIALDSKLSVAQRNSATQEFLDGKREPIIINCIDGPELFGATAYSLEVTLIGNLVRQQITLPDNSKYVRTYEDGVWSDWNGDVIVGSTGLRLQASDGHIVLPSGVEIY